MYEDGKTILVDGRWRGPHGIGRFSSEVIGRLPDVSVLQGGTPVLHPFEQIWLSARLLQERPAVYFTPGFNPPLSCRVPFIFMICDLIHLHVAEERAWSKTCYYNVHLKRAARQAFKVLTLSEYSRKMILDWAKLPPERVMVVGCGVGQTFGPSGEVHTPGYKYLLYVGTHKPHKNIARMIEAFAKASIPASIRLVLTGEASAATKQAAAALGSRVVLAGVVPESQLPMYYRGAIALLFPSLYEGFGLPPLEAMACGTPVITSNVTSLPEVTGRAALYVNPTETEAIAKAVECVVTSPGVARFLREQGLERARRFCWDAVAAKVQGVLVEALAEREQLVH
jgi:glycosyltransferase involved in cell wall biosynthesis